MTTPSAHGNQTPQALKLTASVDPTSLNGASFANSDRTPSEALSPNTDANAFYKRVLHNYSTQRGDKFGLLTVPEYLDKLFARPDLHVRNAPQLLADAMTHFGVTKEVYCGRTIDHFNFVTLPWVSRFMDERGEPFGLQMTLNHIHRFCQRFSMSTHADQSLILYGVPGSGKTILSGALVGLLEYYTSIIEEGQRFRVGFVFDDPDLARHASKKITGFDSEMLKQLDRPDADGLYRIVSPSNADPLFLIPKEGQSKTTEQQQLTSREELCLLLNKRVPQDRPALNHNYLLNGKLDTSTAGMLEALLKDNGGDLGKVIEKHVRIEPWSMWSDIGRGLALVMPASDPYSMVSHLDPQSARGKPLPRALANADDEIARVQGVIPSANRGVLYMEDFLRPHRDDGVHQDSLARLDWLLRLSENGIIQVRDGAGSHGFRFRTEQVNIIVMGDTNNDHIRTKSDGAGWKAFNDRTCFTCVPTKLQYLDEYDTHRGRIKELLGPQGVECPHALKIFSLLITATRLLNPKPEFYKTVHEQLPEAISAGMNVLGKALLFQGEHPNNQLSHLLHISKWTSQQLQLLIKHTEALSEEYDEEVGVKNFTMYDGGIGISTREAKPLLAEIVAAQTDRYFSLPHLMTTLSKKMQRGMQYDNELNGRKATLSARVAAAKLENQGPNPDGGAKRKALNEAKEEIEKLYPVPLVSDVFKMTELFARRLLRTDIEEALGLRDPQQAIQRLKQYIHHCKAQVYNQKSVPTEYRVNRLTGDGAAEEIVLTSLEAKVPDFKIPGKDLKYCRERYVNQLGNWGMDSANLGRTPMDHLPEIFPQLYSACFTLLSEDFPKLSEELNESIRLYTGNDAAISAARGNAIERPRLERWESACARLEKLGYPSEVIPAHVMWLLNEERAKK